MSTAKHSSHPSSRKLLFVADGDNCRKSQRVYMQRSSDHRISAPIDTSITLPICLRSKEHLRRGTEIIQQKIRKLAMGLYLLEMTKKLNL